MEAVEWDNQFKQVSRAKVNGFYLCLASLMIVNSGG